MPVSPEESLAALIFYRNRARGGAQAVADAMAEYIAERVASETLARNSHAPGAYHKAVPGAPPSSASGALARGMHTRPASAGLRATAYAGNDALHARVLEFGCVLSATSGTHMGWKDSGGTWRHRTVRMTPHPFLDPTVQEAIQDGSLRRVAIEAGRPYDP
jgi:hypothetical protein